MSVGDVRGLLEEMRAAPPGGWPRYQPLGHLDEPNRSEAAAALRAVRRHGPDRLRAVALDALVRLAGPSALDPADLVVVDQLIGIRQRTDPPGPVMSCWTRWWCIRGDDQTAVMAFLGLAGRARRRDRAPLRQRESRPVDRRPATRRTGLDAHPRPAPPGAAARRRGNPTPTRPLRDLVGRARDWLSRIQQGLIHITTVTILEVGFSARSTQDLRGRLRRPPVSAMPVENTTPRIESRAVEVQELLAGVGHHRAPSVPDLIIAATAELAGLVVLHVDKDFELIVAITGQPTERLRLS
nr:PIN domain nuclease [Protofrankia symbiont of Coriaria ruscifolia]